MFFFLTIKKNKSRIFTQGIKVPPNFDVFGREVAVPFVLRVINTPAAMLLPPQIQRLFNFQLNF